MTSEEISTFAKVLCYEPANTVCSPEPLRYISEAPTELPQYLAEFTTDKGIIKPGPLMKQCQAREYYVHSYLACEESVICTVCQKYVCQFCIVPMEKTVSDNGESEAMEKTTTVTVICMIPKGLPRSATPLKQVCVKKISW